MLKNYFNSALRHLLKHKSYTLLNAIGLSVGIACFTLIGLWVKSELSYDRFHQNADRIYRINGIFTSENDNMRQAVTPRPLRTALASDLPEVEEAVLIDKNDALVQRDDKQFMEDDLLMTDPAFFKVFSFNLRSGDAKTALDKPYSVILSETMAKKYFGNEDPLGKTLTMYLQDPDGRGAAYNVTGVIEDCPLNSHFKYNALISYSTYESNNPLNPEGYDWYNNGYYTYLLLRKANNANELQAKLPQLVEKYMGAKNRQFKFNYEYFLTPLTDIHLHSEVKYEIGEYGKMSHVIVFGTIGIMVLLLASINYINLATAFSAGRFKEVGMRKVMGAHQPQLIGQYLTESWLLAIASLAISFIWIEMARSLFETLSGKPVANLYTPNTLLILLGIASVVGLGSGFYPALMLSSFHPVNMIKGQLKSGSFGVMMRKALVVTQYAITILLVVGILVVQRQLKYIQQQDLGFNQNNLLMMSANGSAEVISGFEGFANNLKDLPTVKGVTRSNSALAGGLGNSVATMEDASGKNSNATVYRVRTDFDYLDVYEMKLVAGRFFNQNNPGDSLKSFVVKEALVKSYGYQSPEEVLGKSFSFQGRQGEVIGVVKDFNYNSLQFKVEPTCLALLRGGFSQIAVRLSGSNIFEARKAVEEEWRKSFPNTVVDTRFAEEALDSQYRSEQRFSKIFFTFSIISLAIACLGLFALVSFSVQSRVKEIGIRKVLGASVARIFGMFSYEFLMLIVIASVIAVPVGYYFMEQWLSGFAYRITLDATIFILAATIVIFIAWLTISTKSISAALSNPAKSLRTE